MSVYLRGTIYHYEFMVGGARYRGTTKTTDLRKARSFEDRVRASVLGGQPAPPLIPPRLSEFKTEFFEWLDSMVANGRRKATTRRYYDMGWKVLSETSIAKMRLGSITARQVEGTRFRGRPAYMNQAIRTLRRMLGKAEQWRIIERAPRLPLMPEDGREGLFDAPTETAIISAANDNLKDVFIVLQDTALRPGEALRMRIENINWAEMTYFNLDGKTRRSRRVVPISDRMRGMLEARCSGRKTGWVFQSGRIPGGHLTYSAIGQSFRRLRSRLNIPAKLVPYCARHTFATYVMQETGDPFLVRDVLGHADLRTTARYQHPNIQRVRHVINGRNNNFDKPNGKGG